ncbi:hypothetical protein PPEP_a0328 [Pseudoalteromonas peptidolytica F12-50-A1]|uniref:Uncharacterized protein n=1 Tax=Pseudoalteromonas peptidolytica F12-50-A1 TaxID=1315280 RepID=A0A8I0MU78_9GAMM|nr:hypothetical protein [Pseudoalteromonas peptidolytica F12-50-A1]
MWEGSYLVAASSTVTTTPYKSINLPLLWRIIINNTITYEV